MFGLIHFNTYSKTGIPTWNGLPNCSMIFLLQIADKYPFIVWAFKPSWPRVAAKLHNFFSSVGKGERPALVQKSRYLGWPAA